ncbi:hypothetical protein L226DRAFT_531088 [Lentinus tigrinus ALCF2SS1-7]|uniref:DUF6533 domain-containing protein n=1 Tax=Lentinus tigrinus ALCF2SS1-6 TaxID=1328759 RepID=A0A5C2SPR3_9APHY|nr:hypothetical protein L227DRAFT_570654 [Lentinus tigrinus ALCF2SS1-6]RPD79265.1 hypothetical protein L226DRAFT_531088 [Lentinus tigrinus ALCF2SS1-7]
MSNTPQLLRDAIPDSMYLLNLTKDTSLAALTYLIMDVAATLDDEVALMWPSRMNFMKAIFLINRYSPFVDATLINYLVLGARSTEVCRGVWITAICFFTLGMFASEAIIIVRTLAIWNFDKVIVAITAFVTGGALATVVATMVQYVQHIQYPDDDLIAVTGCVIGISDKEGWTLFVAVLIMETTLVAMTMLRHLQMRTGVRNEGPVMDTMYRDGLFFYAIMLAFSIANLCCMVAAPASASAVIQLPLRVIHSTLCSRVLFNLRKAALKSSRVSLSIESCVMFNVMGFESGQTAATPFELRPDALGYDYG